MVLSFLLMAVCACGAQTGSSVPLDDFPPAAREAIARAQREVTARPSDAEAVGSFGRVLQAWEQLDAAHQAYARAQALAPAAFQWHYLDAVVLQRLARHDEAAQQLKTAIAAKADYLPARIKLAEALLETGALDESRRIFDTLVRVPEAEAAAEVGLGRIAAAQAHHEAAIEHFTRAVAIFPELGAAHYGLARSYRALGRAADAERALAEHAKYGPRWPRIDDPVLSSVTSLRDDARALLAKGVVSAEVGEVGAAIARHEEALKRDPSLVQAHANLLSLYGRAGNLAKAEEHYRAAVEAGFATADLYYDYGVVQGMQQKWDAAEEAYRRAIAINPRHANARNNLGQILERRRDFSGSASEYRQASEAQPTFRLFRFNLGRMLLALGQPQQAAIEFDRLQQPVDAETPRYIFALSTAHVRAGRREEGIRLAVEARRLALEYGQTEFAAAITNELAKLK